MLKTFLFLVSLVFNSLVFADCSEERPGEITVSKAFNVSNTLAEVEAQYTTVYESGQRTINRVYFDPRKNSYMLNSGKQKLKISATFIKSLAKHISAALKNGYADFAFYPDMGHAHLYMPKRDDLDYKQLESNLESKDLLFLYHTAELFMLREDFLGKLTDDPWLQWRYFSRNFVGQNNESDNLTVLFAAGKKYNTVSDLDDHSSISTVYFNASRNGCFPFQRDGKTYYFDLTLN